MRAHSLAIAFLLAIPVLAVGASVSPVASLNPDCDLKQVPGVGVACDRGGGYYETFDASGKSRGFVHDHTALVSQPSGYPTPVPVPDGSRAPHCVEGTPGDYYFRFIHLRVAANYPITSPYHYLPPPDYGATHTYLIDRFYNANLVLDLAAQAGGSHADLKTPCSQGEVLIEEATMATQPTNFYDIVNAMMAKGYNDPKVKYFVYFEGAIIGQMATGQANVMSDDRAIAGNLNNGNLTGWPMYAIIYEHPNSDVWLHEITHTLGAVQPSAPHTGTSGVWAFHCTDGSSIMCNWFAGSCTTMELDCGQDDYFRVNPTSGSYLATHWNIASSVQRYLVFASSTVDRLRCSAVADAHDDHEDVTRIYPLYQPVPTIGLEDTWPTSVPVTCKFSGGNPGAPAVRFHVDWGDGQSQVDGPSAAGSARQASHTYCTAGTYTIHVTADEGGTMGLSGAMPYTIQVVGPTVSAVCPLTMVGPLPHLPPLPSPPPMAGQPGPIPQLTE